MTRKKVVKPVKPALPAGPPKVCPISRAQFAAEARPLRVSIRGENVATVDGLPGEIELLVDPKQFASGTQGWFTNEGCQMYFEGAAVRLQVQVSVQMCYSKSLPGGPASGPAVANDEEPGPGQ